MVSQIVRIVADMTGYPPELLDLDLDLEADLGVDTVKQAEVFAAVREQFGIPRDENLRLRDFPTLAHVIGFARDRATRPEVQVPAGQEAAEPAAAPSRLSPAQAEQPAQAHTAPAFTGDVAAAGRLPRRVPVPVLRPPIEWCSPTGVTLDETQARHRDGRQGRRRGRARPAAGRPRRDRAGARARIRRRGHRRAS